MDDVPLYQAPPEPPTRKPWWAYVVAALIGPVVVLFLWLRIGPNLDDRPEPLNTTRTTTSDENKQYSVSAAPTWNVFEETVQRENEALTAEAIQDRIGECGYSCAALSILKVGDYSATGCTSTDCQAQTSKNGASLTIFTFANTEDLSLETFLQDALLKNTEGEHMYTVVFGDDEEGGIRLEGIMERMFFEDGMELQTHYFGHNSLVFVLDPDIHAPSAPSHDDLMQALTDAILHFELQ